MLGLFLLLFFYLVVRKKIEELKRKYETMKLKKAKINKRKIVLNLDQGNMVKTNTSTPLFVKLNESKTNTKTCRQI